MRTWPYKMIRYPENFAFGFAAGKLTLGRRTTEIPLNVRPAYSLPTLFFYQNVTDD